MSTRTLGTPALASDARALRGLIFAFAVGLTLLGVAFHGEVSAAVHVWQVSTAYSHCFFVLPIAAYLGWERRRAIVATPIAPFPLAILLVFPLSVAWLVAERVGIMEGRQLVALCLLQVLVLSVLGPRMWRALSVPLLYLFFLVPFGAFATPALQRFTAQFITVGLDFLGIANISNDYEIEIPEGNFYVAEACAGLRFLIASIAFGVLYACLIYRSVWRRVIFIGVSILVPILANGLRALGIVALGHILGSAEAAATDHVLYGWLFFSLVILLLIAAGLPFRQDEVSGSPDLPWPPGTMNLPGASMVMVATAVGVLACLGPTGAMALDRAAIPAASLVRPQFAIPAGCKSGDADHPAEITIASAPAIVQHVRCGSVLLTVTVVTLPPRANPAQLALAQRQLTSEDSAEDANVHPLLIPGVEPLVWRFTETSEPTQVTASSTWVDGRPASNGLGGRITQAAHSVFGAAFAPILVAISMPIPEVHLSMSTRSFATTLMTQFLLPQKALDQQIASLSAIRNT